MRHLFRITASAIPDHRLPPSWVSCEVLSFGQLSVCYENLAHGNDRRHIAEPYGVDEQILVSFAHHLTYARNVCAHHSRLWNREMTITMKLPRRATSLGASFNPNMPRRFYSALTMLAFMLWRISTGSTWRAQLLKLLEEHPSVDLTSMGFRADWLRLSLRQTAAGDEPASRKGARRHSVARKLHLDTCGGSRRKTSVIWSDNDLEVLKKRRRAQWKYTDLSDRRPD